MLRPNPYHELFQILQNQPEDLRLAARKRLIWAYSWAVPNDEAIDELLKLGPLLELGAGTGYWTWMLRMAGADVVAIDKHPLQPPRWTEVVEGDESHVSRYGNRALFLCWPPLSNAMAASAFHAIRQGTQIAYVGEFGGRTADDRFHAALRSECRLEKEVVIPNWPGYGDRMFVFTKLSDSSS